MMSIVLAWVCLQHYPCTFAPHTSVLCSDLLSNFEILLQLDDALTPLLCTLL